MSTLTVARPTFKTGDTVTVGKNDAGVRVGSTGIVSRIAAETGNPIVDVAGRGRVALTPDSIALVTADTANAPTPPPPPPTPGHPTAHRTTISRELYLDSSDTAAELGIPLADLRKLSKLIQAGTCRATVCRYTATDIHGANAPFLQDNHQDNQQERT